MLLGFCAIYVRQLPKKVRYADIKKWMHVFEAVPETVLIRLKELAHAAYLEVLDEGRFAQYLIGVELSANRAGCVAAGGLVRLSQGRGKTNDGVIDLDEDLRELDLLKFSLSPQYLAIRKDCGMVISSNFYEGEQLRGYG